MSMLNASFELLRFNHLCFGASTSDQRAGCWRRMLTCSWTYVRVRQFWAGRVLGACPLQSRDILSFGIEKRVQCRLVVRQWVPLSLSTIWHRFARLFGSHYHCIECIVGFFWHRISTGIYWIGVVHKGSGIGLSHLPTVSVCLAWHMVT